MSCSSDSTSDWYCQSLQLSWILSLVICLVRSTTSLMLTSSDTTCESTDSRDIAATGAPVHRNFLLPFGLLRDLLGNGGLAP